LGKVNTKLPEEAGIHCTFFIYPSYDEKINNKPAIKRTIWERIFINGLLMIRNAIKIWNLVKGKNLDIAHITTSGEFAVFRDLLYIKIFRYYKIPIVYHIRFGRVNEIAKKRTWEWKLISKAMSYASVVLTIDETTYNAIRYHLPKVRVINIPNPIDINKFLLPKPNICKKTVMFLGWVVKSKGIEELLGAWEHIFNTYKDWTLEIVGPYKDEYYDYLKDKYCFNGVRFTGEQNHEDAIILLNESEIFILPSYTEGYPNVVLEAMALAKPIIATRVGAIPEMLSEQCGVLIEPQSKTEIETTLRDLIQDSEKRKMLGENAFKKVVKTNNIDIIFEKYIEIWKTLVSNA